MKNIIIDIKSGFAAGIGFLFAILIGGLAVYASSWSTSSPTTITNDSALFANFGNTIDSLKWNELVSKINTNYNKGINNTKVLTCTYNLANAGVVGWKSRTWVASDCGGINKPSDFINVLPSIRRIDGTGVQDGIARCENATNGDIYLNTANLEIVLECSYLVWN